MTGQNVAKRAVMVVYYLPTMTTRGTGVAYKVPNMLRKHGFVSFDGSCWFGHEDAVAALDFEPIKRVNGRFQVVPFEEVQWEAIRAIARLGLEKDVEQTMDSVNETVAKAQAMFQQANREQSVGGIQKASRYLDNRLRLAKKRLNEALEAAVIFDLMGDAASLFDALRTSIAAHEETRAAVKAMVKERVKAARKNPAAEWGGHEQVEMEGVGAHAE